ncbi:MAG TPA: glycosyltransferase [Solirubrobacteraceae bacterium]|nr:glycosyltransferase [Solirubrobacteraceae bacterium]
MAPPPAFRLLVVAPFERGREQGGSQRATALAERMEERGVTVGWRRVGQQVKSRRRKALDLARLKPGIVGGVSISPPANGSSCQIAVAAHSFLAPQLEALPPHVPRVVDFHNLEWQHMADSAALERPGAGPRGLVRKGYLDAQVRLIRRFERSLIRRSDLSLFVSEPEIDWAHRIPARGDVLLVPSVLPRATEQAALEIAARRRPLPAGPHLVYVGTLAFPPNALSLVDFLERSWPAIRNAFPAAWLAIAGGCDEHLRASLERHPGVRALGYVDDLGDLLARCTAAVMPFEGLAGTSLRALFYALAGVPVVGSPGAFRGLTFRLGIEASTPNEWAEGVGRAAEAPTEEAHRAALGLQRDAGPWDDLRDRFGALARTGDRRGA